MKKVKIASQKFKPMKLGMFMLAFALIGSVLLIISHAAPGGCDATGAIGTATYTVSAPETATYKVWVRMQIPDTTNTGNNNGIRLEFNGASTQCFTVTSTSSTAVNSWQWINTDATAASTPLVTSSITAGNYTAKILGLKAGIKVDKVLLLRSDSTCVPSNDFSNGSPGDNCTTDAPTVTLGTNPTTVASGGTTVLTWSTTNATSCTATGGWTGAKATSGSLTSAALTADTTFTLNCSGPGGNGSASKTVTVTTPAPTVTLTASPTTVVSGSASTLTWSTTNATACTASGDWTGAKATSGSQTTGNLTANRSYTLTCQNAAGVTANKTATVTVTAVPPTDTTPPTITMNAVGVTIPQGATSVKVNDQKSITWTPLASDTSGIKTLTAKVNGATVTLTNGSYTFGGSAGGNGDYTLDITAVDNANNTATATIVIKLRHPDFNRDGIVNIFDLSALLNRWGQNNGYDLNANGTVDIFDLSFLLNRWNATN